MDMSSTADVSNGNTCLKIGLIGAGNIGKIYLKSVLNQKRFRVVYIVDEDVEEAKQLLGDEGGLEYGMALPTEEADLIFEDKSIKGLIIASSGSCSWVLRALKCGMAVLCEASLCLSLKDTLRCFEIAEKVRQPLICGFNLRFHPQYIAVRNEIETGGLGDIAMLKISLRTPEVLMESLVRHIDLLCWILGSYPGKVTAVSNRNDQELSQSEAVVLTMKFDGRNTIGLIEANSLSHLVVEEVKLQVFGSSTSLTVSEGRSPILTYHRKQERTHLPYLSVLVSPPLQQSYVGAAEHFYQVARGMTTSLITAESVINAARIVDAFKTSAKKESFVAVDLH